MQTWQDPRPSPRMTYITEVFRGYLIKIAVFNQIVTNDEREKTKIKSVPILSFYGSPIDKYNFH